MSQQELNNAYAREYAFLDALYQDPTYPTHVLDKIKDILIGVCGQIERSEIKSTIELYQLTHAATEMINDLEEEFFEADSELDTMAAEVLAGDFIFIAEAYDFDDAEVEEMIAPRMW